MRPGKIPGLMPGTRNDRRGIALALGGVVLIIAAQRAVLASAAGSRMTG